MHKGFHTAPHSKIHVCCRATPWQALQCTLASPVSANVAAKLVQVLPWQQSIITYPIAAHQDNQQTIEAMPRFNQYFDS